MTFYCNTMLKITEVADVQQLLSAFTREKFRGGRAAYALPSGGYNIDGGENDIRAYFDESQLVIRFLARYQKDIDKYDNKLREFAVAHSNECEIVSHDSIAQARKKPKDESS